MKARCALLGLLLVFIAWPTSDVLAIQSTVQERDTPSQANKSKCTGRLKGEGPEIQEAVANFWREMGAALGKSDKQRLAKMMAYPLGVHSTRKFEIANEKGFVRHYDEIFPKQFREMLLRQPLECVGRVGVHGFSVRDGQLWFDRYPDGRFRIFTINVVVYPGD